MKQVDIEKLRQLISRTDMTGNQKVDWLVNFIDKNGKHDSHDNDIFCYKCLHAPCICRKLLW